MRIGQSFGPNGVGLPRGVERRAVDGGFAERVGAKRAGSSTVAAAGLAPLTSLGAVLAVQAVDDPLGGRRRARERGDRLLDALEDLRLALIEGRLPAKKLAALQHLVSDQRGRADDPRLEAVLGEIELRAAVELAKLEQAADG